ncbi:MAG: hypothetical protein P4L96_15905 [Rhodoferax sp.]|nr:hypothetical protein [Rhodoferax sp.]
MKKLLALAAFILAFAPLAQAQDAGPYGHPEARNDRSMQSMERDMHQHRAPAKHMRHMKHHRPAHHKM